MFGPAGRAYVYRIYGLHWCLNFTCGEGAAILIRALEPKVGLEVMRQRRGAKSDQLLCSGPGRLCQALGIDGSFGGMPLDATPLSLSLTERNVTIRASPRIGVTAAKDIVRRFTLSGSAFLSRPS